MLAQQKSGVTAAAVQDALLRFTMARQASGMARICLFDQHLGILPWWPVKREGSDYRNRKWMVERRELRENTDGQ
jgi:hypothetical protein